MSRPTITALIHTRNEERWIEGCVRAVAWADETVVADMASNDRTRELATGVGARVIDVPVARNVEEVRNEAMAQCRGDWLLVVDADEIVSPGLRDRVLATVAAPGADAYWVPRRNYFFETWLEHIQWPDPQLRLFRRGVAHWSGVVHEPPSIAGTVAHLPAEPEAALEHPGCCFDMGKFLEKYQRYAALEGRRTDHIPDTNLVQYLLRRPLSEFLGRYGGGGWRHGVPGLVFCLLLMNYQFMIGAHLWADRRSRLAPVAPAQVRRTLRWELLRTALKAWRP
ncbi:MAG: glycosyltransferase family 2 protein [Verrucomicrobia bacterium]|nr:MAG: glycosyltransferase family 2 protein [Verrucomicrobiota bacterium]